MAICRICGVEYSATINSALQICNNDGCWKKAWNDAVAPFRKEKQKEVPIRQNYRTTPYEKEQVIQLFKSGKTRKQIANTEGIGVSYETVCKIIKDFRKDGRNNH